MINDPPLVMRKRAPARARCSTIPAGVLTSGFRVLGLPISLLGSAKAFLAKSFFVGLSFSAVDFFAFVRAGSGSIGLAFARAVLAAAFRFLAHRAFAAALIFALATAESLRRFCVGATSTAGFADDRPIIAVSWARLACNSAICAS